MSRLTQLQESLSERAADLSKRNTPTHTHMHAKHTKKKTERNLYGSEPFPSHLTAHRKTEGEGIGKGEKDKTLCCPENAKKRKKQNQNKESKTRLKIYYRETEKQKR